MTTPVEPVPCKECGNYPRTHTSSDDVPWAVSCGTASCPLFDKDIDRLAWNILNTPIPAWSRVRATAQEKPPDTMEEVMALPRLNHAWIACYANKVRAEPGEYPFWHYPAPIPVAKEPGKFEQWCARRNIPMEEGRDEWNAACDLLNRPEEKVAT